MLKMKNSFDGSFQKTCHEGSVPNSLLCLVDMIVCEEDCET